MENNEKINLLRKMIKIRCFEEKSAELKLNGEILGMVHCTNGQEAVDVGACSALTDSDYILSNHRPHGHMIAKGADINLLLAEMFGKRTGTNGGKGGSMHISDKYIGSLGATGIVGSGLPVACGAAFASKYKNNGKITCVFFGDGATNEGTFHESMNLASIWKLPIIFLLINNCVAVTTLLENVSISCDLYNRTKPYGIKSMQIDGQNVEEVYYTVKYAISEIRKDNAPVLIEAKTYRFNEHAEGLGYARMADAGYRDKNKVESWKINKDPIKYYIDKLIRTNTISDNQINSIYKEEIDRLEKAIKFAKESPIPDNKDAYRNVFI